MLINLTPHKVNIVTDEATASIPSSGVARVKATYATVGAVGGVPVTRASYGEVEGLPSQKDGTTYIVSTLVRMALPSREDLVSPGDLVRNAEGEIIGCKSFISS